VEIQVDGLDMAGSYTGSLWVKHSGGIFFWLPAYHLIYTLTMQVWKNLSLQLLKSGLASLRPSASRLLYKQDLYKAERAAIEERWALVLSSLRFFISGLMLYKIKDMGELYGAHRQRWRRRTP
jgi:hypothetical protein